MDFLLLLQAYSSIDGSSICDISFLFHLQGKTQGGVKVRIIQNTEKVIIFEWLKI